MHFHDHDHSQSDQYQELVMQYLEEFRKFGDLLDAAEFDDVVAHNLGLDPNTDEFRQVQAHAEHLIHEEIEAWHQQSLFDEEEERVPEQTVSKRVAKHELTFAHPEGSAKAEEGEQVRYINVDFNDMEDEDTMYDDYVLADKRLDIEVFHFSND